MALSAAAYSVRATRDPESYQRNKFVGTGTCTYAAYPTCAGLSGASSREAGMGFVLVVSRKEREAPTAMVTYLHTLSVRQFRQIAFFYLQGVALSPTVNLGRRSVASAKHETQY